MVQNYVNGGHELEIIRKELDETKRLLLKEKSIT